MDAMTSRNLYRINYGNGQVSDTFRSLKAARRELDTITEYREFAFIQFRENGEWFRLG